MGASKVKYYFASKEDETCYEAPYFKNMMELKHFDSIEVYEAIPEKIKGFFWCVFYGEIMESCENPCGKHCKEYRPRNKVSGICTDHSNILFTKGKKLTLKRNA